MTDHALLLVGLAAICAAITLVLATLAVGSEERQRVRRSVAAVTATRLTSAPVLEEKEDSFSERVLLPASERLAHLARALSPAGIAGRIQQRLDLAGNPGTWDVDRILAFKGLGLVAGPVVALLWHASIPVRLALVVGLGAAGFYAVDLFIYNVGLKRQDEIRRGLPDAMDLLTICVEAGLGFDAALSHVSARIPGAIAGEFQRVLQEMQIGKTRTDAFRSLADRTTVPELRAFVSSLTQADAFGIPVANVLREQSKEARIKRRQRAEEKAQKVPVKIMVPLVLFILPSLFIVVIGPGMIQIINNFKGTIL
jgi:tight adherence protein C